MKQICLAAVMISALLLAQPYAPVTAPAEVKYTQDMTVNGDFSPVFLDAMRQETEIFQVVFPNAPYERKVTLSLTFPRQDEICTVTMRRTHYISAKLPNQPERIWPDALLAVSDGQVLNISPGQKQALYVTVTTRPDAEADIYRGTLKSTVNGKTFSTTVTLRIRNLTLPQAPTFKSAFAFWGMERSIKTVYGITPRDPRYKGLFRKYYDCLLDYRCSPTTLPPQLNEQETKQALLDPRFTVFYVGYENFFRKREWEMLKRFGVAEKGYQYLADEPHGEPGHKRTADLYARHKAKAPDVPAMVTSARIGQADVWCPLSLNFNPKNFDEEKKQGKEIWFYTCDSPRSPMPNYHINRNGFGHRMSSWMGPKYNLSGELLWAVTLWTKPRLGKGETSWHRDVWTQSKPDALPPGDGLLIYPAKNPLDPPVPTIRLELIRQGHEDWDSFNMLRKLLKQKAAELKATGYDADRRIHSLINRIMPHPALHTRDYTKLQQLHTDLLDEIETLSNNPAVLIETSVPEGDIPVRTPIHITVTHDQDLKLEIKPEPTAIVRKGTSTRFTLIPTRPGDFTVDITAQQGFFFPRRFSFVRRFNVLPPEQDQVLDIFDSTKTAFKGHLFNAICKPFKRNGETVFTYKAMTRWPEVGIDPGNWQPSDGPAYKWIEAVCHNPNAFPLTFGFCIVRNGLLELNTLAPGETKRIILPFIGYEDKTNIQFFMNLIPTDTDLIIRKLTLHTLKPQGNWYY